MHKHHEESIENMKTHYSQNKEIVALFLIGSVATGTERPNSDLDGVAVVSQEYNEILFPSVRKLEIFVINTKNKPDGIVEKCQKFLDILEDECAQSIIKSYEDWTSYDYPDPKNFQFISNNYFNPWEH